MSLLETLGLRGKVRDLNDGDMRIYRSAVNARSRAKDPVSHRARCRKHYAENREQQIARVRAYQSANQEKTNARSRAYSKKRYATDPQFKVASRMRTRLGEVLRRGGHSVSVSLGLDRALLVAHIESQFKRGMTWENHGMWHIDHIIPCSEFDLTDEQQVRQCFNYLNLRPMWAIDNIIKGDTVIPGSQIPLGI